MKNVYQDYELVAYLGGEEMARGFDLEAIIEEATEVDYRTGNRYWKELEPGDLDEIAQRHERG